MKHNKRHPHNNNITYFRYKGHNWQVASFVVAVVSVIISFVQNDKTKMKDGFCKNCSELVLCNKTAAAKGKAN